MVEYVIARFSAVAPEGTLVGVVVARCDYLIGEDRVLRPSPEPSPVRFADRFFSGDDLVDPVILESDTVAYKGLTDVVVLAVAYAPGGRPVPAFDVSVAVGRHSRVLTVCGPRHVVYRGPANPSLKEPVSTLPAFSEPEPCLLYTSPSPRD